MSGVCGSVGVWCVRCVRLLKFLQCGRRDDPQKTSLNSKKTPEQAFMKTWRAPLKHVFIIIMGAVVVVLIYVNAAGQSGRWDHRRRAGELTGSSAGPQWGDPGPYHVAYPRNYKFIVDDTPTCKSSTPFLILMVPVAPGDAATRDLIRQTWGGENAVLGQLVKTVFVVGLPRGADAEQTQEKLRKESRLHRDLIQSNFQDSYYNLTIKTMVMLEWLAEHCTESAFVMKVDSDVLLHVRNLLKLLLKPGTAKHDYMTGLVWWHSPVLRNPFNRFYMPRSVIAGSEYPPYPLGMAYVMSLDLPGKILGVSPQIKPIFIEDAYLGMCLKRLGVSPTDPPRRDMFMVTPKHPLKSCSLSKVVAVTTTSPSQLRSYWERSREEVQC